MEILLLLLLRYLLHLLCLGENNLLVLHKGHTRGMISLYSLSYPFAQSPRGHSPVPSVPTDGFFQELDGLLELPYLPHVVLLVVVSLRLQIPNHPLTLPWGFVALTTHCHLPISNRCIQAPLLNTTLHIVLSLDRD